MKVKRLPHEEKEDEESKEDADIETANQSRDEDANKFAI